MSYTDVEVIQYEECCAFKIAVDLYGLSDEDMETICERTFSHEEDEDDNAHDPDSEFFNNRVLMAVSEEQFGEITRLKNYIKRKKYSIDVTMIVPTFVNPKTGNKVRLYMVSRRGPRAKKSTSK